MSSLQVYRCEGCGGLFAGQVKHACPTRIWRDQRVPNLEPMEMVVAKVELKPKPR